MFPLDPRRAAACLAVTVALSAATAGAAPPLTLGDALAAVAGHPALDATRADERRALAEAGVADARRWPAVDLEARGTVIDEPIVIDLDPIRRVILGLHRTVPAAAIPPFTVTVQDDAFWKGQVRATWPVWTGGKIAAGRGAAAARVDEAKASHREAEERLLAEAARRYFGLALAEGAVALRADELAGVERHLADARRLEEEGLIARVERLHAEVAQREAARALEAARQDAALARSALATLLHREGADVDPGTPLFVLPELPPLDGLRAGAREANPVFGRLAANRALAARAEDAARAEWRPDVALFAFHELHRDDLTLLEPDWAAGVSVRLALFDGFARARRREAARHAGERVDALTRAAQDDVGLLVEKHWRTAAKALEQYRALSATTGLAEESLRARTRAFAEGLGTSLDVIDARTTLARVRLARLAAAHDFDVALADLLAAGGTAGRLPEFAARPDREVP